MGGGQWGGGKRLCRLVVGWIGRWRGGDGGGLGRRSVLGLEWMVSRQREYKTRRGGLECVLGFESLPITVRNPLKARSSGSTAFSLVRTPTSI